MDTKHSYSAGVTFKTAALACLIIALSALAAVPSVKGEFFNDDVVYVSSNQELQSIPLTEIWRIFLGRPNGYREYAPIRDISYRLDMALYGDSAAGYHVTNIILYILVCVAAWRAAALLLMRLAPEGGRARIELAALATAALFAAHPAHVESVAWISGRKDLLSALFLFMSIAMLASSWGEDGPRRWSYTLSLWLFVCALLTKATVSSYGAFAIAAAISFERLRGQSVSRSIWRGTLMGLPFIAAGAIAVWVSIQERPEALALLPDAASLMAHAMTSLKILGTLIKITVFPYGLRLMYGIDNGAAFNALLAMAGAACLAASAWAAYKTARAPNTWHIGLLLFTFITLPYLQIIPFVAFTLASERFVFAASFGAALAAGAFMASRPRLMKTVLPAIAAAFLAIALIRAIQWQAPNDNLFLSNAKLEPDNIDCASLAVSVTLVPRSRFKEARLLVAGLKNSRAKDYLNVYIDASETVLKGVPAKCIQAKSRLGKYANLWSGVHVSNLMGWLSECAGDDLSAAKYYFRVRKMRLYGNNKDDDYARLTNKLKPYIEPYRQAAASNPADINARMNYASRLMEIYDITGAEREYKEVLARLNNKSQKAVVLYNLGLLAMRNAKNTTASELFRSAIALGYSKETVYNNLGSVEEASARFKEAEDAYRTAMAMNTLAYKPAYNLGRMFIMEGRKGQAIETLNEGMRRAAAAGADKEIFQYELDQIDSSGEKLTQY